MKSPIVTKQRVDVDIADETMSFMAKAGGVVGAVIGIWGFTCLMAGLISAGPVQLIQGYISAITGL